MSGKKIERIYVSSPIGQAAEAAARLQAEAMAEGRILVVECPHVELETILPAKEIDASKVAADALLARFADTEGESKPSSE